eukprot:5575016-Prymnesium_polylepis.3
MYGSEMHSSCEQGYAVTRRSWVGDWLAHVSHSFVSSFTLPIDATPGTARPTGTIGVGTEEERAAASWTIRAPRLPTERCGLLRRRSENIGFLRASILPNSLDRTPCRDCSGFSCLARLKASW